MTCPPSPLHYLANATAADVTLHGLVGSQRVMSYPTIEEAHDACRRFLVAAFAAQGRGA